jgi:2,3-dihydroxybenzoate decarboxylase
MTVVGKAPYKRIATEEAWATLELFAEFGRLLDSGYDDPGFKSLWGFYLRSEAERPKLIRERMVDLGARRLADMDATGIDMQLLLLTAPGVNMFEADVARGLRAAGPGARCEGNRARRDEARPEGRDI